MTRVGADPTDELLALSFAILRSRTQFALRVRDTAFVATLESGGHDQVNARLRTVCHFPGTPFNDSAVMQRYARARDKIFHRSRNEHFTTSSSGSNARPNMHGRLARPRPRRAWEIGVGATCWRATTTQYGKVAAVSRPGAIQESHHDQGRLAFRRHEPPTR